MPEKGIVPRKYRHGLLANMKRNTAVAHRLAAHLHALESDRGGPEAMSTAERTLAERAVWLTEILREHETRLARGEPIALGDYVRGIQTLTSLLKTLGMRRVGRKVQSLREVIDGKAHK
jgi:hypothetical protein